ncbi:MAG: MFS transporter [Limisphaerales bacterium]
MNPSRKIRNTCFVIEGLNSFATVLYFNYLYFFMRSRFGFEDKHNLLLAAVLGFVYIFAAWQGGKLAHRHGYLRTLKLGFSVMIVGLLSSLLFDSMSDHILAAIVVSIGMCATWPTLEALVSESETPAGVPRVVGIYNITWAVANAVAFFIGGTLIKLFGFKIIFIAPIVIVLAQLALTFWMEKFAKEIAPVPRRKNFRAAAPTRIVRRRRRQKTFLRMAWLANPFAYIAINTLIAVIPRREIPDVADVRGIHLLAVVFRPARHVHRAVALDGLALSLRLARRRVRDAHFVLRSDFAFAKYLFAHWRTNLFRRRHRADLLFVAVLLDGRRRREKRAWRHPRGGDWPGQLRRPRHRRGGAAIFAAISKQRRDCCEHAAAVWLWRIDFNLENGEVRQN